MSLSVSSDNYEIFNEYESVYLFNKNKKYKTLIGDFYGNPTDVIISVDEKYCVIVGCGLIVYFFQEPYYEYKYNFNSDQWKEWGRSNAKNSVWIDSVKQKDDTTIEIETEDDSIIQLDVYNLT